VEAYVPYAGPAADRVATIQNGLRAALGYAGAAGIKDLWRCASFGLVTATGSGELGAHSVMTKEAS
jgi:IMP dehydrogenase